MPLVKAKFAWAAQDAGELSFQAGDVINVIDQSQEGWWQGTLKGKTGFFPNNYVEEMASRPPSSQSQRGPPGGSRPASRGPASGSRPPSRPPSSQLKSSRGTSRVSTNASAASAGSNSSGASYNSYSSYNSQSSVNSRSPMLRSSSPSTASQASQGSRAPMLARAGSPSTASQASSQGYQQGGYSQAGSPPPYASRGPTPAVGGSQASYQPQKQRGVNFSKVSTREDLSLLSDSEWDQRARAKGQPPYLDDNQRYQVIDRLIADARSSFSGTAQKSRGARALAANALRAVTLYDNTQNKGVTDYDEDFEMKKNNGMMSMPEDQELVWDSSASTDNFAVTKFGVMATNMAIGAAWSLITLGALSIVWGMLDERFAEMQSVILGIYAIAIAFLMWGWEYFKGYERKGVNTVSYKGILYLILSVPLFFTYPLILGGAMLVIQGFLNIYASAQREQNTPMKKKKKGSSGGGIFSLREGNKLSKLAFLTMFAAANILIFIFAYMETEDDNAALPPDDRVSVYGPPAKGFGNVLDFNCAIILVPVARTFIRWLYNASTRDQGGWSKVLRGVLWFFPIDKALEFHKLCAFIIVVSSFGHTISHFVNYVLRPPQTLALYGLVPWYTGGAVILIMFVMYTAAVKNVKGFHFELFWYSHHLFIAFYVLLIVHGNMGFGPNFWKWLIVPGTLYTAERILREYNANKEAVLVSVTFMKPDCFSVRFAMKGIFANGYKEGQYVFLNCPYVSPHEWHPFTLSSAPGEEAASLHIRVQNRQHASAGESDKSWTQRVKEYLHLLVPAGAVYHEFVSNAGQDIGVVKGPDGQAVLKIDGPHSAPTQHVSEYSTTMICGAGIGVTPLAATLKSIVHHRWRTAVGNAYPNNAHFYWVCAHRDLQAFRWMIRTIKDATDAAWNMRLKDKEIAKREFHVHAFITSVPKDAEQPRLESIPGDSVGFWGVKRKDARNVEFTPAPFTEQEMYQVCMAPPEGDTQMCELVTIHKGRPNWDTMYSQIKQLHPSNEDIGVMFCGNPVIAHALKGACTKHSASSSGLYFKLHKENF